MRGLMIVMMIVALSATADQCTEFPTQCAQTYCLNQWTACDESQTCRDNFKYCDQNSTDRNSFFNCVDTYDMPLLKAALKCTVNSCCQANKKWMSVNILKNISSETANLKIVPTALPAMEDKCEDFPERCAGEFCRRQWNACFSDPSCMKDASYCGETTADRKSFMKCAEDRFAIKLENAVDCTVTNCCQANKKKWMSVNILKKISSETDNLRMVSTEDVAVPVWKDGA
jgi:hypothetical protein